MAEVAAPLTARLLEVLAPADGQSLLEVGCGAGEAGHAVAASAPGARLLQTDFAPEMVDAARRRATELGLRNVEHAVADMQELPFADGAFDGVVSRWGVMLCPDPGLALRELARVLRPGGRAALATWAEPERNAWGTVVSASLVALGLAEPPDPRAPGPFALADRDRLLALAGAAGLRVVSLDEVAVRWRHASADAFWEVALDLSSGLNAWLADAADADVRRLRERLAAELARFAVGSGDGAGIVVPGVARVLLAAR